MSIDEVAKLHLNSWTCDISSIDDIGNGLATLTNLTELHLDFAGCRQTRSIGAIGKGLKKLTKLTKLHVNFGICDISSIDEIGDGLATRTISPSCTWTLRYAVRSKSLKSANASRR